MERRLEPIGPSQSTHGRASRGSGGNALGKIFLARFVQKAQICNQGFIVGFVAVFLRERKDYSRTLYYSLIIMKSLPLRGCRQIAKPCKYCLVRVIVFFSVCFLYFFCFSQVGNLVKFPIEDCWWKTNGGKHNKSSWNLVCFLYTI